MSSKCLEQNEVTLRSLLDLYENRKLVSLHVVEPDVDDKLVKSIGSAGLQQPIMVADLNGTMVVIDGWRRFLALLRLSEKGKARDPKVLAMKVPVMVNKCVSSLEDARVVSLILNTVRKNERQPKECRDLALLAERVLQERVLTPSELRQYFWCESCAAIMNYLISNNEEKVRRLVMSIGAKEEEVAYYIQACKDWHDAFLRASARNTAVAFFANAVMGSYSDKYPNLAEEFMKALAEAKATAEEGAAEQKPSVEGAVTKDVQEAVEEVAKEQAKRERRKVDKEQQELEQRVAEEYGYTMPSAKPSPSQPVDINDVVRDLLKSGDASVLEGLVEAKDVLNSSIEDVCENYLVGMFETDEECRARLSVFADKALERALKSRYSGKTWREMVDELRQLARPRKLDKDGNVVFTMHPLVFLLLLLSASPQTVDSIVNAYWYWIHRAEKLVVEKRLTSSESASKYIYAGLFVSLYPLRHITTRYSNMQVPRSLKTTIESLAKELGIDEASLLEYAVTLLKSKALLNNNDPVQLYKAILREAENLVVDASSEF
jgi:Sec-independent protein translocase protein TatA